MTDPKAKMLLCYVVPFMQQCYGRVKFNFKQAWNDWKLDKEIEPTPYLGIEEDLLLRYTSIMSFEKADKSKMMELLTDLSYHEKPSEFDKE